MLDGWRRQPAGLVVIDDDPDMPGGAVGPRGRTLATARYDLAVVWSGAWDEVVWGEVLRRFTGGADLLLVLTQVEQHAAWVEAVGTDIPLLEIKP